MSFGIKIRCWGDLALFTRPEMKVERVSYDVITPSAARGVIEAIYWKPEIRWVIDRLYILRPIRFTAMRRNEVGAKAAIDGPNGIAKAMKSGKGSIGIYVDDSDTRQQRAAMMLRDVAYVIEAHFEIIAGEANEAKHLDQFNRRARDGQCFKRPYLGTRECAADFELIEGDMPTPDVSLLGTRDLGWMLHDIDFANGNEPRFFRATMVDGAIDTRLDKVEVAG